MESNQLSDLISSIFSAMNQPVAPAPAVDNKLACPTNYASTCQNYNSLYNDLTDLQSESKSSEFFSPTDSNFSPSESNLMTPLCDSGLFSVNKDASFPTLGSDLFNTSFCCCGGIDPSCILCYPQIDIVNSVFGNGNFTLPLFAQDSSNTLKSSVSELNLSSNPKISLPSHLSATNLSTPSLNSSESSTPKLSPEAVDSVTDKQRERCDKRFLDSLPPQLALKRKRPRSFKQTSDIEKFKACTTILEPSVSPAASSCDADFPVGDSKRNKNTDAARRSRLRKALKLDALESQVVNLELENSTLKEQIKNFESEKKKFSEREELLKEHIKSMNLLLMSALANKSSSPL
ncbi:hypothetical protein AYI70_g3669 [Smittium culicis]|uniref:BZIP domain-containing protein n=1 Tax=Smittium culicis TaxID=133412 RepID=A0A1R1Y2V3_9FUNG|nr:hypothetical protein AYI70_g3669 [Smittium culicis]